MHPISEKAYVLAGWVAGSSLENVNLAINVDQCYFVKQSVVKQAEKD